MSDIVNVAQRVPSGTAETRFLGPESVAKWFAFYQAKNLAGQDGRTAAQRLERL